MGGVDALGCLQVPLALADVPGQGVGIHVRPPVQHDGRIDRLTRDGVRRTEDGCL